jgi:hypothetical protein
MITRPFGVVKSGQVGDPNSVPNVAAAARHLQRFGSTGAAVIGYESDKIHSGVTGIAAAERSGTKPWKVPILISYAYWNENIVKALKKWEGNYRLYLDSGAFTAYKQGKEINFEEYCAFVKSPPVPIERYFMLDKIGDPKVTKINLEKMLKKGLKPVPIFTRGEDVKELDAFYKVSSLVGLGGIAGTSDANKYVKWFEQNARKGRQVHWLGFAHRDFILYFKPTSFDSTAWVGGCRFGFIQIFHDNSWRKCERKDVLAGKFRREITELGFHYDELKREENWHRVSLESYIGKITAVSWLKWAKKLETSCAVGALQESDFINVTKAYAVVKSEPAKPNSVNNAVAAAQRLKVLETKERESIKAFAVSMDISNASPDHLLSQKRRVK